LICGLASPEVYFPDFKYLGCCQPEYLRGGEHKRHVNIFRDRKKFQTAAKQGHPRKMVTEEEQKQQNH
jgi:hypothetical protein